MIAVFYILPALLTAAISFCQQTESTYHSGGRPTAMRNPQRARPVSSANLPDSRQGKPAIFKHLCKIKQYTPVFPGKRTGYGTKSDEGGAVDISACIHSGVRYWG